MSQDFHIDPSVKDAVDTEIVRVLPEFKISEVPDDAGPRGVKYIYVGQPDTEEDRRQGVARLRLDFEINKSTVSEEMASELIFEEVRTDLYDLLTNGDREDYANPLYNAVDGAVKRGKELESLVIGEIHCYRENKERKGTIEYTLYMRIHPMWAD